MADLFLHGEPHLANEQAMPARGSAAALLKLAQQILGNLPPAGRLRGGKSTTLELAQTLRVRVRRAVPRRLEVIGPAGGLGDLVNFLVDSVDWAFTSGAKGDQVAGKELFGRARIKGDVVRAP